MYYITVALTDKAKKMFGTDTKSFVCETEQEPTDADIQNVINEQFMSELVESVLSVKKDFRGVKIGDIMVVHIPMSTDKEELHYGEVVSYTDNGYGHEFTVRITDEAREYSWRNDFNYRFNFEGYQIGGKRKDKTYVTVATPEDIAVYNNIKNRNENYSEIVNLLHFHKDWEDYEGNEIPRFLTSELLATIKDMLLKAKDEFYKENSYD